jgi:peptide/nickel transport system ATP-binding protein
MAAELLSNGSIDAPILEARAITRHFPAGRGAWFRSRPKQLHAVDDVTLTLLPAHVTALVGESGSGKSTVARLLAEVYPLTSGEIRFHGEPLPRRPSREDLHGYRAQVQMIFQDPFSSLNPVKTIEHHIARPLRIHHVVPRDQVRERVFELLTAVGLDPPEQFAIKYPHELSGGQRQRVAIARALAVEPKVLLADEPISMLDVSIRIGILNLMLHIKEQRRIAFLYITHDIASARYVADEVIVLYAGQVVERGETEAVLQTPLHPYTRLLLSAVPDPATGLQNQRLEARGEVHAVIDPPPGCRFANRCPLATDACRASTPELIEVQPGRRVRCPLFSQLPPQGPTTVVGSTEFPGGFSHD